MPRITVDYTLVGFASSFSVPVSSYRKADLLPGTRVLLVGDGVDDQVGVVVGWSPDNLVNISLLAA
jgi:hypothetical protein